MNVERYLEILTNCYLELNKLLTEPGQKSHMLANSIYFIEKMIKRITEQKNG